MLRTPTPTLIAVIPRGRDVVNGWLITAALVWAYVILLFWLLRSGKMEQWNLSLFMGFILMIRTQKGRGTLDVIARPKRLWNIFGDFGIAMTLVGMVLMTALILLAVAVVLDPANDVEPLKGSEILVIPGVNPFVPLWYGIIALIITLVVHEGGHGVLARANNLKVKSLGLLYVIVPIGAFVEPDEEEMAVATRRKRLRVFAAGATVNIVVAALVLAAMGGMAGNVEAHDGVPVQSVTKDGGAEAGGIMGGDVLVAIDGAALVSVDDFRTRMESVHPGDTLNVTTRDGTTQSITVTSRWDVLTEPQRQDVIALTPAGNETCELSFGKTYTSGAQCAEDLQNAPLVGIQIFDAELIQGLFTDPFDNSGTNLLALIQLPIFEIRGTPVMGVYLPAFFETPFENDVFWPLFQTLFWVFWINLLVGLTNILPMLPLDGGHIFRDAVGGIVEKARPQMERARRDRIVGRSASIVSLMIFAAIILQIVGPRFI